MNKQLYYKLYFLKNRFFPNEAYDAQKLHTQQRSSFYSHFIDKGDLVFDIGANMGNRVAAFLALNAQVIAVEPQGDCCIFLKERFGKKITIVKKGIGSQEDALDFYIADSNVLSTFSRERINKLKDGRFSEHSWKKSEKIGITTLDNLISIYGIPAFIKIDVEGMELEVMKGLTQKIRGISFEYTVPEETEKLIMCMEHAYSINKNAIFNYSIGESMTLESDAWLSFEEMKASVNNKKFVDTAWGDIYIRNV